MLGSSTVDADCDYTNKYTSYCRAVGNAEAGASMVAPLFRLSRGRCWMCAALPARHALLYSVCLIEDRMREGEQWTRSYLIQLCTGWRMPGMEASFSF